MGRLIREAIGERPELLKHFVRSVEVNAGPRIPVCLQAWEWVVQENKKMVGAWVGSRSTDMYGLDYDLFLSSVDYNSCDDRQ